MISQFCVLSVRGDAIISKDYRYDTPKGTTETFFRAVKLGIDGKAVNPVFHVDGVNYFHIKAGGLLFLATSTQNCSPSLVLGLIERVAAVVKDYLGVLNEDAMRKNFILVYELLDEMIDFGVPTNTSTEGLKQYIHNTPIAPPPAPRNPLGGGAKRLFSAPTRTAAQATFKSVMAKDKDSKTHRDEVFVDIVERISVTFNSAGYVLNSELDGAIMMKSFLTNNPDIKLALNENLSIGQKENSSGYLTDYGTPGAGIGVTLDDCNFHTAVRLEEFEVDRTLTLTPPDGEFAVMKYRTTTPFKPPFKVMTTVEEVSNYMVDVTVRVRAEFPEANNAASVNLMLPLPKATIKASCQLGLQPPAGQTAEYKDTLKQAHWTIKKLAGGSEHVLRVRVTLPDEWAPNTRREMGPVSMSFTIPMYNLSRLQVRYLQILNRHKTYNPYRWVRYVTQSSSYVCRM